MGTRYDKALQRLRQKRMNNPEYTAFRNVMAGMAEPVKQIGRRTNAEITRSGGSIGAMGSYALNSQQQIQNMATQQFSNANTEVQRRNTILDDQIEQLTQAKDAENDQQKDNLLRTGLQMGGTAIGAGIGTTVTPGAGTLAGAQIGSSLGNIAASFVGGGGKMDGKYVDEQRLVQGIADTAQGIAATVSLKEQKDMIRDTATFFGKYLGKMTTEELIQARALAASGDLRAWREFTAQYELKNTPQDVDEQMQDGIPDDDFIVSTDPTGNIIIRKRFE